MVHPHLALEPVLTGFSDMPRHVVDVTQLRQQHWVGLALGLLRTSPLKLVGSGFLIALDLMIGISSDDLLVPGDDIPFGHLTVFAKNSYIPPVCTQHRYVWIAVHHADNVRGVLKFYHLTIILVRYEFTILQLFNKLPIDVTQSLSSKVKDDTTDVLVLGHKILKVVCLPIVHFDCVKRM